jgi:hypothetical protein
MTDEEKIQEVEIALDSDTSFGSEYCSCKFYPKDSKCDFDHWLINFRCRKHKNFGTQYGQNRVAEMRKDGNIHVSRTIQEFCL